MTLITTLALCRGQYACRDGLLTAEHHFGEDGDICLHAVAAYEPLDAVWALRTTEIPVKKALKELLRVAFQMRRDKVAINANQDRLYYRLGEWDKDLYEKLMEDLDSAREHEGRGSQGTYFCRLCLFALQAFSQDAHKTPFRAGPWDLVWNVAYLITCMDSSSTNHDDGYAAICEALRGMET